HACPVVAGDDALLHRLSIAGTQLKDDVLSASASVDILRSSSPSYSSSGRKPLEGSPKVGGQSVSTTTQSSGFVSEPGQNRFVRREERGGGSMPRLQRKSTRVFQCQRASVRIRRALARLVLSCATVAFVCVPARAQNVLTQHNDIARTGANNSE